MKKLRSDSTLAELSEDQRADLYDWLQEHTYLEVMALAAKPESEGGFGLHIHKTTLARFRSTETKRHHARQIALSSVASCEGGQRHPELVQLLSAARLEFAHATYGLSLTLSGDPGDPKNFDLLERALHHTQSVALEEQRLQIERGRLAETVRQFNYNAGRAALNHLPELIKIARNQSVDNEEKIWAASEICFGPDPCGAPVPGAGSLGVSPNPSFPPQPPSSDPSSDPSSEASAKEDENLRPAQPDNLPPSRDTQIHENTHSPSLPATHPGAADENTLDTLRHAPAFGTHSLLSKAPMPRTAREWLSDAANYDAVFRYLTIHIAGGSADRLEQILKSDSTKFTVPVELLTRQAA